MADEVLSPRRRRPRSTTVRALGGHVQPLGGREPRLGGSRELLGASGQDQHLDDELALRREGLSLAPSLLGGGELFAPSFGPPAGSEGAQGGDGGSPGSAPGDPADAPGPSTDAPDAGGGVSGVF
jgi:hypothetical protein